MNESSSRSSKPNPDPSPNTREVLRALVYAITEHEKRLFGLASQFAALQIFLRIDLPILLGNVLSNSKAAEKTDQQYDEIRKFIHRVRARIESDLDTRLVEVMSHKETESMRQTIDLLERSRLENEEKSNG